MRPEPLTDTEAPDTGPILDAVHPSLSALTEALSAEASLIDRDGAWPAASLARCGQSGVYRGLMPSAVGGLGWSPEETLRILMRMGAACLTTTFIITQRTGACRRLAQSPNEALRARHLPALLEGERFATVGISHLTTSRRHLGRPAMAATPVIGGVRLSGVLPWVTGAAHAALIVAGATLPDGQSVYVALDPRAEEVRVAPHAALTALTGSHTTQVHCDGVFVADQDIISSPQRPAPPSPSIIGGTGGLQTSALTLGTALAALEHLATHAEQRPALHPTVEALSARHRALTDALLLHASGRPVSRDAPQDAASMRAASNDLVRRTTRAALLAARGAGFLSQHPANRWCREALFFDVWSVPDAVTQSALRDIALIHEAQP